jgi:hypothetical protein
MRPCSCLEGFLPRRCQRAPCHPSPGRASCGLALFVRPPSSMPGFPPGKPPLAGRSKPGTNASHLCRTPYRRSADEGHATTLCDYHASNFRYAATGLCDASCASPGACSNRFGVAWPAARDRKAARTRHRRMLLIAARHRGARRNGRAIVMCELCPKPLLRQASNFSG